MSKLKVFIAGSTGRVGLELQNLCSESKNFELVGLSNSKQPIPEKINADVVIDFSSPDAFDSILEACQNEGIPFVSGTTGLSPKQFEKMEKASQVIPVCWASNMSLGVAFINKLLKTFGELEGFDFQIEEIHHRHKKDAPSGTAITLQKTLQAAVKEKVPEPLSLRGGGVFGVHKIWAFSEEEVISLEHQALNRRVFAKGALKVAQWIKTKSPRMYQIEEVL